jgi:hypothetical protein
MSTSRVASVSPPQIPYRSGRLMAYRRHGFRTGHWPHILSARSTASRSLGSGKKLSTSTPRQCALFHQPTAEAAGEPLFSLARVSVASEMFMA